MSHVQSSRHFECPRDENFRPPASVTEFLALDYLAHLQFYREYPAAYKRLASQADRRGKAVWEE